MNRIVTDAALNQSLVKLDGLTELRDDDGRVLGYFAPACHDSAAMYVEAAAHFDPDEMKRRKESNTKGSTTSEVLDRIKSLEQA